MANREPDPDRDCGHQRHRQRARQHASSATPATISWRVWAAPTASMAGRAPTRRAMLRQRRRQVSLMTGMGSGGDAQGDTLISIENLTGSASTTCWKGIAEQRARGRGWLDTVSYEHALAGVTVSLAMSRPRTPSARVPTRCGFENSRSPSRHADGTTPTPTSHRPCRQRHPQWRRRRRHDARRVRQRHLRRRQHRDVVDETGGTARHGAVSVSFSLADSVHAMGDREPDPDGSAASTAPAMSSTT